MLPWKLKQENQLQMGLSLFISIVFGTNISWLSMPLSPLDKKIPIENESEGGNRESWG